MSEDIYEEMRRGRPLPVRYWGMSGIDSRYGREATYVNPAIGWSLVEKRPPNSMSSDKAAREGEIPCGYVQTDFAAKTWVDLFEEGK